MYKHYLAIDLGASSGRIMVASEENIYHLTEVYRFNDYLLNDENGLVWNIDKIYNSILKGLSIAFQTFTNIISLSIDSWGVDYVLLNDNEIIRPCFSYRNNRTKDSVNTVNKIISARHLFSLTGIQYQPFNSIYQLCSDHKSGRLSFATDFLMIPEFFTYLLTGKKVHEYTNAATTGLLRAGSREYESELIHDIGLPKHLFTTLVQPGAIIGDLKREVQKIVKGNCQVVMCASHDTASAIEGLEIDYYTPYISSGTWSLIGIKVEAPIINDETFMYNYTNEGGPNYIRLQKNIMGFSIINCLKQEFGIEDNHQVMELAKQSNVRDIIDVNHEAFLEPTLTKMKIDQLRLNKKPINQGDYFNIVFHSLANAYLLTINQLEKISNRQFSKLYLAGGGSMNQYMNQLIYEMTGLEVIIKSPEATSLGNVLIQKRSMEHV